ncbi:MAG: hypothetical protein KAQ98_11275 [Bacteriovoracaceae bacterium]|nr:hypothetical protein [Bacteriovoracaceae bacterium]
MHQENFQQSFHKGITALEELQSLAPVKLTPMVSRAWSHFSEMKRVVEKSRDEVDSYGVIARFLNDSIRSMMSDFMLSRSDVAQVNLTGDFEKLNFLKWNKMLEAFPKLMKIVGFFRFENVLEIGLSSTGIKVAGSIHCEQNITDHRLNCYSVLRELIRQETLLTFKITERVGSKCPALELFLDFSHDPTKIYALDLMKTSDIILGFSNVFENYILSNEQIQNIGKHVCLEITRDLELKRYNQIPEQMKRVSSGQSNVVHFPFLFRPVSIIIPVRGDIKSIYDFSMMGDTRSGGNWIKKQEVGSPATRKFKYIDIFSLITS